MVAIVDLLIQLKIAGKTGKNMVSLLHDNKRSREARVLCMYKGASMPTVKPVLRSSALT